MKKRAHIVDPKKENWKRPIRFPVHMSEELYKAIEDQKWKERKSMTQIINEVLEKEFLKQIKLA